MVDIKTSSNQSVEILTSSSAQTIEVNNATEQSIDILPQEERQNIEIIETDCSQGLGIGISIPCPAKIELQAAIISKVPKALSILPRATSEEIASSEQRQKCRVYIDIDGKASFATLEQIKELNTKTICVDSINDERVKKLSNEDLILLKI